MATEAENMARHLPVWGAFFCLLIKQLISQNFFNSLIRKSFFNLTHYHATSHLLKWLFNYSELA